MTSSPDLFMLYHCALSIKYVFLTMVLHAHPDPQKYTVCYFTEIRHMETLLNSERHENLPTPESEDCFLIAALSSVSTPGPKECFPFIHYFKEDPSATW